MEEYDVVIVGAGPAGLSAARELSNKKISVLVIEKNRLYYTDKTWLTFEHIIKRFNLKKAVSISCDVAHCRWYLGSDMVVKKRNVINVFDEVKLLKLLIEQSNRKYLRIIDKTSYHGYKRKNGMIQIRSSKGVFLSKIMILAQGGDTKTSAVAYYTTYARIYEGCRSIIPLNEAIIQDKGYPINSGGQWSNPVTKDKYLIGEINFSTTKDIKKLNLRKDKKELQKRLDKYAYSIQKYVHIPKNATYKEYYGVVPVNRECKYFEDNIIIIGDAAKQARPFYGININHMFEQLSLLTKTVEKALKKKDYSCETLCEFNPLNDEISKLNMEFGLIIWRLLEDSDDYFLNEVLGVMSRLDGGIKYNFLTGKLTKKQLKKILIAMLKKIRIDDIKKHLPPRDYLFLLKESEIIGEELIEEIKEKIDRLI